MHLRVPHPLRSLQRVGYANVGIEILGSHPSQRTRRMGHPEVGCTSCRMPFHPLCGSATPVETERSTWKEGRFPGTDVIAYAVARRNQILEGAEAACGRVYAPL
jgi:hypothetical protein